MIAGIIGAAGYAGAELVRLLSAHPRIKGLSLGTVSLAGERIENVYPNFLETVSSPLVTPEEVIAASDLVFLALPHAVGEPYVKACFDKGISCIDLSADFRFDDDEESFKAWYGKGFIIPQLRERSVYGLPELNRQKLKDLAASGPVIVSNPGCYPTSASLGVFPALAKGLFAGGAIVVNSVSGHTGGGRDLAKASHFPECSDSIFPYKVGAHRHAPEISRTLGIMAASNGAPAPGVVFTPHLAPLNRGILSTIYIPVKNAAAPQSAPRPPSKEIEDRAAEIRKLYADFYRDEPFVRVLPLPHIASTGRVRLSNYCDISVHLDMSGSTLIIASAIDNMLKGASGQAVQNMNILYGFGETEGIGAIPALF